MLSSVFMSHRPQARSKNPAASLIRANGFSYSRKLSGHTACVNALAFSSGDGRFLASGGDDLRVRLWDFYQEDVNAPSCSFLGPWGNILSLAFSATNHYLYSSALFSLNPHLLCYSTLGAIDSGGTDQMIVKFDTSRLSSSISEKRVGSPDQTFREHNDSIRDISCHPVQDELFLSAGEDGRILFHDGRAENPTSRAQDTLQLASEVTGVRYHPLMEHIFATSDGRGQVCLRDFRMAFGPSTHRTRQGVVQLYNTKLSKKDVCHLSNPESSSITFDREGNKLAVTMLHYFPTIYSLSDPHPLAVCSGRNSPAGIPVPPGERTYSNSCTMKHGCFGGPALQNDDFYCAGSDDFRGYVWTIPNLSELAKRRKVISHDSWLCQDWPHVVGFAEGPNEPRYVPVELSTPLCQLTGHRSIVNTTVFHPHFLHIVTSGIERDILLHSPTPSSPCSQILHPSPSNVRRLPEDNFEDQDIYFRALAGLHSSIIRSDESSSTEELNTIRMFDHILRQEGETNIFAARRWKPDSDNSDDDMTLDMDTEGVLETLTGA